MTFSLSQRERAGVRVKACEVLGRANVTSRSVRSPSPQPSPAGRGSADSGAGIRTILAAIDCAQVNSAAEVVVSEFGEAHEARVFQPAATFNGRSAPALANTAFPCTLLRAGKPALRQIGTRPPKSAYASIAASSLNRYRKSSSVRLCENFSSPSTSSARAVFCFCRARIFSSMLFLIRRR